MTQTELFKSMDLESLKNDILALHNIVDVTECFGSKDLIRYQLALQELKDRGLEIVAETTLGFREITNA